MLHRRHRDQPEPRRWTRSPVARCGVSGQEQVHGRAPPSATSPTATRPATTTRTTSWAVAVLRGDGPRPAGPSGYVEVQLATSFWHPADRGAPGRDRTRCRTGSRPPGARRRRQRRRWACDDSGAAGPVDAPSWLPPTHDIAAIWPDLDTRDFGMSGITVSAISTGDTVTGYFDYLRITRQMSGAAQFDMQTDMQAQLAPKYPGVTQFQGLEVSWLLPHINWFGGKVALPNYGTTKAAGYPAYIQNIAIPAIHASGGLASYNHPYGYSKGRCCRPPSRPRCSPPPGRCCWPTGRLGARPHRGRLQRPPGRRRRRTTWRCGTSCRATRSSSPATAPTTTTTARTGSGIVNNFFTTMWADSTWPRPTCWRPWRPGGPGARRWRSTAAAWT